MNSMSDLTLRQQEILDFIHAQQTSEGAAPTLREIARHFGFRSMTAAADHVRALQRKGLLTHRPRQARAHGVIASISRGLESSIVDIPIYGSIPAGFAEDQKQETKGTISINAAALGIRHRTKSFALEVRGDSMIGKHIVDGDYVILERGKTPRSGDVVAALIDNESTLKTFVLDRGRPCLRAENPRYPALIPTHELAIQGVMVALIRKKN